MNDHHLNGSGGAELAVSLTVRDLGKSFEWYKDVLGFSVEHKYEKGGSPSSFALKLGAIRLTINHDDGAKGWDRVKGEGFSLRITTDRGIDEFAKWAASTANPH